MREILLIFLGWALGILSPSLIERIGRGNKKKQVRKILVNEMRDLKIRLVMMNFLIKLKVGGFNHDYLEWLKKCMAEYEGNEAIGRLKELLNKPELQIKEKIDQYLNDLNSNAKGGALSLRKMGTPILDSNISVLDLLNSEQQTKIFELKYSLNVINEEIETSNQFKMMTFDSSLTLENHEIVINEINNKNGRICEMSFQAAEKIDRFIKNAG